jgi:hypothetical protein
MTTSTSGNRSSYVYAGLAGETAPGRVVKSGLYGMTNDDGDWELLTNGLPEAPAIRAIAAHPLQPEVMYVGTQHGPIAVRTMGITGKKSIFPIMACRSGR